MLMPLLLLAFAAPAEAKITWPGTANVQPGAQLTVKVTSKQRRAQLAFVRVSPRATLARKTLRTGRFTVTVPRGDGVSYELRATVAGRRTVKRFTTPKPAPAPAPPPAPVLAPAPAPAPVVDCAAGNTGTAALTVTPQAQTVDITIRNLGPGCLDVPVGVRLDWRTAEGDPIPLDCSGNAMPIGSKPPACIGLPAFMVLHEGESITRVNVIPRGLEPGTYGVSALGAETTVTLP